MKNTTIIIAIIIVIMLTIGIYSYGKELNLTKSALKLHVSMATNESNNNIEITNITFIQTTVPVYYSSADDPVDFPDISIEARNGTIKSNPVSHWVSLKRTGPNGSYDFTLVFREPYKPQKDDLLLLSIRMNDFRGKLEYKTTAFYGWK